MNFDDLLKIIFYDYEKPPTVDLTTFKNWLSTMLDDREFNIIMARFGIESETQTFAQIATWVSNKKGDGGLGITEKTVLKIEGEAIKKLQDPSRRKLLAT